MTTITTTENKQIEISDAAHVAILKLKLTVKFVANWNVASGKSILADIRYGNSNVFLRGSVGRYFLEVYDNGSMYPTVYAVNYVAPSIIEVTEEDYQNWLNK